MGSGDIAAMAARPELVALSIRRLRGITNQEPPLRRAFNRECGNAPSGGERSGFQPAQAIGWHREGAIQAHIGINALHGPGLLAASIGDHAGEKTAYRSCEARLGAGGADRVEDGEDTLARRFPKAGTEIQYGASLTVRESQMAVLVNEGKIADVSKLHLLGRQRLGAGAYELAGLRQLHPVAQRLLD